MATRQRTRRRTGGAGQGARRWPWVAALLAAAAVVGLVALREGGEGSAAPVLRPEVVAQYPHDTLAFTQGLLVEGGAVYESTGLYGRSSLRRVDLATGRVVASRSLGDGDFAEGLAALDGRLYQLTWRQGRVYVADVQTLAPLDTLPLAGEGWGLTEDGRHLILSDGSDRLRVLDPATLAVVRTVEVRDGGRPVPRLNELEYVDGLVYANVWQTGRIAAVDPQSGAVVRWLDLGTLHTLHTGTGRDVLNGIAHDPATGHLLVTGKLWPSVYAVEVPAE
ncbi:glutaminyl-peptide cyclotransferase [Rubrivirga sp. S365]|uniref:Glutaminyl-peptide cyclotransferase n=1 Tax=Rubrivirga litoralis TaxID=3075598 RepID=A0ABU3BVT0_9BACT|nr:MULTISPECIES: glutaminyl-peptide cyclotransferase [unclassified Rubrivirga]MDT0633261.1 glutaminyl-peptide cyclotransferase [Rubrivirga sp. F394]MDT7856881.1 glutaminyl-peptide cyclotransferase [Rubrivirga sp. S365]